MDSVLESTRAEEERVKRETAEGLELFRRQQDEADKKARREGGGTQTDEGSPIAEEEWVAAGRKRKRNKDKEGLRGVKVRRASSAVDATTQAVKSKALKAEQSSSKDNPPNEISTSTSQAQIETSEKKSTPVPAKSGLSLVDYASDEDD